MSKTTKADETEAAVRLSDHASHCRDCRAVFVTYALIVNHHRKVPTAKLAPVLCHTGKVLLASYERVAS